MEDDRISKLRKELEAVKKELDDIKKKLEEHRHDGHGYAV